MRLDKVMDAAREYKQLQKLNENIQQLSCRSLAHKLEYSRRQIAAAEKGIRPSKMDEFDFRLVQQCVNERERLIRQKNGETRESLLRRHKITNLTLMEGLGYLA